MNDAGPTASPFEEQENISKIYSVIGTFRSESQTEEFNRLHARKGYAYQVDVAFPEQIEQLYTELYKRFDVIDVLVNNAGYGILGAIEEISLEEARMQMEVNFFGALHMTQKILPMMRQQKFGHIVQMSSMAGFSSAPACGMYNASKFALEGFSEALAMEVALFNIKVLIVEPGPFRTNFCGAPLKSAAKKIVDYKPALTQTLERIHHQHGKQEGDPQKAVEVIIQAVYSDNSPLRLPLGKIAFDSMHSKMESVKNDLEAWRSVSLETSFL